MAARLTKQQKAEKELTAFALALPETDVVPGLWLTRYFRVRKKGFLVLGGKEEPLDQLTLVMKLPVAAEMVEQLYYVREAKGWYRQHSWIIAHFDAEDDIGAEMETLKGWIVQSYCAMAPKKLARLVGGG